MADRVHDLQYNPAQHTKHSSRGAPSMKGERLLRHAVQAGKAVDRWPEAVQHVDQQVPVLGAFTYRLTDRTALLGM